MKWYLILNENILRYLYGSFFVALLVLNLNLICLDHPRLLLHVTNYKELDRQEGSTTRTNNRQHTILNGRVFCNYCFLGLAESVITFDHRMHYIHTKIGHFTENLQVFVVCFYLEALYDSLYYPDVL